MVATWINCLSESQSVGIPIRRRELVAAEEVLRQLHLFLSTGTLGEGVTWERSPSVL